LLAGVENVCDEAGESWPEEEPALELLIAFEETMEGERLEAISRLNDGSDIPIYGAEASNKLLVRVCMWRVTAV
jgi:hypothetical protein